MIPFLSIAVAGIVALALSFGKFARSSTWRATVTPLASIIGSGFLICGPLLAKEFGSGAFIAMALLLAIAYAVGEVMRFNIIHVEEIAPTLDYHDTLAWTMRLSQIILSLAYAVSVAYYLKLLAEFLLKAVPFANSEHDLVSNILVTAIIAGLSILSLSGDTRKIEHAAHASVSIKIGLIAGLLVGLGVWWGTAPKLDITMPSIRASWASIPMLLGLLITVQGFETSRYLGALYNQAQRVQTMRLAQWISSFIYLSFIVLLTPVLEQASQAQGVAGIYDIMYLIAPVLGLFVIGGALTSQLSAAIADTIGAGGLLFEVSRRKLSIRAAFVGANLMSIAVVWLTNPFEVIALSSRFFAAYYAAQTAIAFWVSRRTSAGEPFQRAGFIAIGIVCLVAALVGAPAES